VVQVATEKLKRHKRPLRRARRKWKDNIKMYLTEIKLELWVEFICLRIGAAVNFVMNSRLSYNTGYLAG
jgi:hypothetical protein